MKINYVLLLMLHIVISILSTNLKIGMLKSKKVKNNPDVNKVPIPPEDDPIPNSDNNSPPVKTPPQEPVVEEVVQKLPDIPIYFQGWLKYLHFKQDESNKAKRFYKNSAFETQHLLPNNDKKTSDEVKNFKYSMDLLIYLMNLISIVSYTKIHLYFLLLEK